MKTTIELPDPLLRQAKAAAAARGESLKELFALALREHLSGGRRRGSGEEGWRAVFGRAKSRAVADVDAVIAADLERVDPADWR